MKHTGYILYIYICKSRLRQYIGYILYICKGRMSIDTNYLYTVNPGKFKIDGGAF